MGADLGDGASFVDVFQIFDYSIVDVDGTVNDPSGRMMSAMKNWK